MQEEGERIYQVNWEILISRLHKMSQSHCHFGPKSKLQISFWLCIILKKFILIDTNDLPKLNPL